MRFSREIVVLDDLTRWARGWGPPAIRLSPEARRGHRSRALVIRRVGGVGSRVRSSRELAEPHDSARSQLARSSLLAHARGLDRVPPPDTRYLARPLRATILSSHVGSGHGADAPACCSFARAPRRQVCAT